MKNTEGDQSYGLKKGPWSVSYTAGGKVSPGFTFVAPVDFERGPEVYISGEFMCAINFDADGAVDACVRAGEAFRKAGIEGAPDVGDIKKMLGVSHAKTST